MQVASRVLLLWCLHDVCSVHMRSCVSRHVFVYHSKKNQIIRLNFTKSIQVQRILHTKFPCRTSGLWQSKEMRGQNAIAQIDINMQKNKAIAAWLAGVQVLLSENIACPHDSHS